MIAEKDKQDECTETDMISPEAKSEVAKKQTDNFDTPKRSRKRRITIAPEEYSPNHKIMYTVKILLPSELKMYPSQQIAMGKVIQALNKKQNVLIESPTGSGKTMALLASSCAWLQRHKLQQICLQHPSDADNSGIQNDNNNIVPKTDVSTDMKCTCIEKKKIQIYYATRTHTQISQVIKEFERLPYGRESGDKQLRHTILASREQSCVNVELREHAIKEVKDLKEACKEATDLRNCKYRNNLFKKYEDPRQPNELRKQIDGSKIDGSSSIWDIEDIAETLKNLELCPYYATNRLLIDDADIIFTPFNYLINQTIRNSSRIDLENSIVILDEAHNVENICRDSASFSFKETEFHVALKFLNILIWKIVKELEKMSENPSIEKDILLEQKRILQKIKNLVLRFSNFFCKISHDLDSNFADSKTKTWEIDDFFKLLKDKDPKKNLYFDKDDPEFDQYLTDFERITRKTFENNVAITLPTPITSFIQKYFCFMNYFQIEENKQFYKCNVTFQSATVSAPIPVSNEKADDLINDEVVQKDATNKYATFFRPNFEATLNFWCFSPSTAFKNAFSECHSVILASGTLSPTATLKTELGLKFDLEMKGEQGIPKEQIFASVVSKGASGNPFRCTYDNMKNGEFYIELLKSIRDVCKTVPKGVLVFVSSYHVLDEIRKYMNFENLKADIEKHKKIFFEPKRSTDFKNVFDEYTFAIQNENDKINSVNGAILFGVFRGKVSEGIDFPDDMARCVICVGIPFPNFTDEEVKQKRAFNDLHSNSMNILSGNEWYSIQAYRAINQALGRCLRHRNDWGAILLFDERFRQQIKPNCPESERISSWIRPLLQHYSDHPSFINGLVKFIDDRKTAAKIQLPVKETVKSVEPLSTPTSSISIRRIISANKSAKSQSI